MFGFQDAALAAENMVIAAESLGLGSCFIGNAPYYADKIAKDFNLPERVFPLVILVMGYPAENPPPRPRYPIDFVLFEDKYPDFDDDTIKEAMEVMDEGYMAQGYYRDSNFMIKLEGNREETFTFDDYSWTEHISRKWGQWGKSPKVLLEQFKKRGFNIPSLDKAEE
jgi:nitroreductase